MAGEAEFSAVARSMEMSAKALLELLKALQMTIQKAKSKGNPSNDELGIGKVSLSKMMKEAHNKNFSILAQDGIDKKDASKIAKYANHYGIAVAINEKKASDTIAVTYRESDKAIFEQLMTDIFKEKVAERPHELMSFKFEGIKNASLFRQLLNSYNLTADTIVDKNGDIYCVHEIADKKAFDIAKRDFKNKLDNIKENLNITKTESKTDITVDENGITNESVDLGYIDIEYDSKNISFSKNEPPDNATIRQQLKDNFGFDDIEIGLAISKIADEMPGTYQKKLLDENLLNQVTDFESNIHINNENILIRDFEFYRINTKNGLESYMVQDEEGKTATLIPEIMTTKQMNEMIDTRLGIKDKNIIDELINKAEILNNINRKLAKDIIENYTHDDLSINRSEGGTFFNVQNENVSLKKSYSLDDKKSAIESIQRDFNISKEDAQEIFKKAKGQRIISQTKEKLIAKSELKELSSEKTSQTSEHSDSIKPKTKDDNIPSVKREDKPNADYHNENNIPPIDYSINEDDIPPENFIPPIDYSIDEDDIPPENLYPYFEEDVTVTVERKVGSTFSVTRDGKSQEYNLNDIEETRNALKNDFNGISDDDIDNILNEVNNQNALENEVEQVSHTKNLSPDQKVALDKKQFNVVDGVEDMPPLSKSR